MLRYETSLVELKSQRAQCEIQQLGLRRRLGELAREAARLEEARRRGEADGQSIADLRDRRVELSAELARLERLVGDLDEQIDCVERGEASGTFEHLVVTSLQASGELDRQRTQILEAL